MDASTTLMNLAASAADGMVTAGAIPLFEQLLLLHTLPLSLSLSLSAWLAEVQESLK
jgi:hypothetical protein